jgi:Bacteriophage lambda head decoration protein D
MTTFEQKAGPGSCIIQEGAHYYSRDEATIVAGTGLTLPVNTVLGQISADGNYAIFDPAAVDGTEVAAAILVYSVTDTEKAAILSRHAQVKSAELNWISGISSTDKTAGVTALAGLGIIVR